MKQRAMYFTKTNAVVLKNSDIEKNIKNLIINPELKYVGSTPPHYWILKEGKIVTMNKQEKEERDMLIQENGVVNDPEYVTEFFDYHAFNTKQFTNKLMISIGILAFIIGFILRGII